MVVQKALNVCCRVLCGTIVVFVASVANAGLITYDFHLNTVIETPVTNLVLYAAGESEDDVFLSPIEVQGPGTFHLSYTVDFEPTEALVLGISLRPDRDPAKWDIIMFASVAFAADMLGQFWRDPFPNDVDGMDRRIRHSELTLLLQAVYALDPASLDIFDIDTTNPTGNPRLSFCTILCDANSLDLLTSFLQGSDAAAAYFDPYGSFSIIQWTKMTGGGGSIPEPATLTLFVAGLAGLGFVTRRRRTGVDKPKHAA